jgi:hypothetical protein
MVLPFRTDDGLFLEDKSLLIPWGTPLEPESTPGGPDVLESEDAWTFVWRSRKAMGGLTGDVLASRGKCPSATVYPSGLPTLHRFLFVAHLSTSGECSMEAAEVVEQLRSFLKRIHDILEGCIGAASWSYPGYALGLPSITWERGARTNGDQIHFSCAPADDRSLSITVTHWTTQYRELRSEAERLRGHWARSDARVPFVAWEANDPRIPERLRAWRISWSRHEFVALQRRLRAAGRSS